MSDRKSEAAGVDPHAARPPTPDERHFTGLGATGAEPVVADLAVRLLLPNRSRMIDAAAEAVHADRLRVRCDWSTAGALRAGRHASGPLATDVVVRVELPGQTSSVQLVARCRPVRFDSGTDGSVRVDLAFTWLGEHGRDTLRRFLRDD